jgi:hypothetical protein
MNSADDGCFQPAVTHKTAKGECCYMQQLFFTEYNN